MSKGGRVLYGPFCEVERGVPRDQAGGAMGNDGCALRECDRVSRRLSQDRERINPATRRQGADLKKENITIGGWLDKTETFCHRILHSNGKEQVITVRATWMGLEGANAARRKPISEGHTLCDSIHLTFSK